MITRLSPADAARLLLAAKLRVAGGAGSGNFGHSGGVGGPGNPGGSSGGEGIASTAALAEQRVAGIAAVENLLEQAIDEAEYTAVEGDDEESNGTWDDLDSDEQYKVLGHWQEEQYSNGDFEFDDEEFVKDAISDLNKDEYFIEEVEKEFYENLLFQDTDPALPLEGKEEFDLVNKLDPDTIVYDTDDVATLVDTDQLRFTNGKELTAAEISLVEETWKDAYDTKLEKEKQDIYESDAYSEARSEAENQYFNEQWSNMSDNEKLSLAAQMDIYPESSSRSESTTSVDSEPDEWVTGLTDDDDQQDYNKTRAIANKLAELRTTELIKERELLTTKPFVGVRSNLDGTPKGFFVTKADGSPGGFFGTREEAEAAAKLFPNETDDTNVEGRISNIWDNWKTSSSNDPSVAFQIMTAKELGGVHRFTDAEVKDALKNYSVREQGIMRAYARAQWETTQFILDKAGTKEVEVYRGLQMAGLEVDASKHEFLSPTWKPLQGRIAKKPHTSGQIETHIQLVEESVGGGESAKIYFSQADPKAHNMETVTPEYIENFLKTTRVGVQTRLPDLELKRNGLQSTTTKASVANKWGGVGNLPANPKRVVLRARVPATSVLSLPVFGVNVKNEQEVVVMGAKDRWEWDAWKNEAPSFTSIPIKSLKDRVYKGLRSAMVTQGKTLVIDMKEQDAGQPHWLNIEARLKVRRRGGLRTLGSASSGNWGHSGGEGGPGNPGGSGSKTEQALRKHLRVETDPKRTFFLLSDGTRLGGSANSHEKLVMSAGLNDLRKVIGSGVVRYVPGVGVQASSLTEKQAEVIADDWNTLFAGPRNQNRLQVDLLSEDGSQIETKAFEQTTADGLRNFVNKRLTAMRAAHPPETAVHRAADANVAKFNVAVRYAFAMGRRAVNTTLLQISTNPRMASTAMRPALEATEAALWRVLPGALAATVRDGGKAAGKMLKRQLRAAGGPGSGNFGHSGGVGGPGNPGGSGSKGGSTEFDALAERLSTPDNGFTLHTSTGLEVGGPRLFSVALKQYEKALDAKTMTANDLVAYAIQHRAELAEPGNHFGGWHDPESGKIYLDVSRVVNSARAAARIARNNHQYAYYDFEKGKSVPVKGRAKHESATVSGQDPAGRRSLVAMGLEPVPSINWSGADSRGYRQLSYDYRSAGGPGSGNFGHVGRPGQVGGSGLGGDSGRGSAVSARPAPNADVTRIANAYAVEHGFPPVDHSTYHEVNPAMSRDIAAEYDALPVDDSTNPEVIEAYEALAEEVDAQYAHAVKNGVQFIPWTSEGQPYSNSKEMAEDIRVNKRLYFFTGGEPHPFASKVDPVNGLSINDKFRAIHDYFGHAAGGFGFGPRGEENAWATHSQMFSLPARKAMTTETRGQNSWVNFGRQNYDAVGNYLNIPAKDRPYATQKVALLPERYFRAAVGNANSGNWGHSGGEGGPGNPGGSGADTSSPAFKAWFKDSKIVDKDGNPLLVHHGSVSRGVQTFDPDIAPVRGRTGPNGVYFTSNLSSAAGYTRVIGSKARGEVVSAYLSMQNPLDITKDIKAGQKKGLSFGDAKRAALQKLTTDHDGVIFRGDNMNSDEYVVLKPNQIKSVRNSGAFDLKNPSHFLEGFRTADDHPIIKKKKKPFTYRFDETNPDILEWAEAHAAELIEGITKTTRERINRAVVDALDGGSLREAVSDIVAQIGDNDRAELIAHTETMRAANEGQRQSWQQAIDDELLPPNAKREWIATADQNICPICEELNGKRTTLDGEYPDPGGDGPPQHPRCRCTEGIVG